jgi:hypothetical protein
MSNIYWETYIEKIQICFALKREKFVFPKMNILFCINAGIIAMFILLTNEIKRLDMHILFPNVLNLVQ